MDAAWKVYVGDRRFDDNQISNLFLKLKYETVGRFTFDFRPIDGDESYMVVNNTLRIFWGDLHKLDGVIQRVDWDDSQYCYHVFGADIRGFLLDRVNTEPSTVSSYTSDIQTQVQYTGCDFPSNIWTGAGDKIGTYTFHYKLGIQNTIRITSATQNIWHNVIERGTVYEHLGGCLYDATKNWEVNKYAGATLRFVSGACKNNVYNINGNSSNRVCIRLPGELETAYAGYLTHETKYINGMKYRQILEDPGFERASFADWLDSMGYSASWRTDLHVSGAYTEGVWEFQHIDTYNPGGSLVPWITAKPDVDQIWNSRVTEIWIWNDPQHPEGYWTWAWLKGIPHGQWIDDINKEYIYYDAKGEILLVDDSYSGDHAIKCTYGLESPGLWITPAIVQRFAYPPPPMPMNTQLVVEGVAKWDGKSGGLGIVRIGICNKMKTREIVIGTITDVDRWTTFSTTYTIPATVGLYPDGNADPTNPDSYYNFFINVEPASGVTVDNVKLWREDWLTSGGTIPGCSRLGDIYEIVTASMERIEPASLTPATLEKDNHIIRYNNSDDLSDHTTVVTVMGAD